MLGNRGLSLQAEPEIAYFGSIISARMAVSPTFSVACSVASIHICRAAAVLSDNQAGNGNNRRLVRGPWYPHPEAK